MKRVFFALSLWLFLPLAAAAGAASLQGVRVWSAPDNTRLVFELSDPIAHSLFTLHNPDRLVIDLKEATLTGKVDAPRADDRRILQLRHGPRDRKDLRVVLDLRHAVRAKSFLLKPSPPYGHRLVIDLLDKDEAARGGDAKAAPSAASRKGAPSAAAAPARDIVIAIDAGHGGEDPGAIGARGSHEKDVVLSIARRLERLVRAEPGMRPVLTRTGDYYVGLRKRMDIARKHRADLFVSIHADAFDDARARGSSVFVLSERGASSEAARWLAERENAADLVGGVTLEDKDEVLASVLLDLSQTGTRQASLDVAGTVFRELNRLGEVHGPQVQQAGFVVLKSPDVPSMLVETAFISNPDEERRLNNPAHQQLIAEAMMRGIRAYFKKAPPPNTLLAEVQERQSTLPQDDAGTRARRVSGQRAARSVD
ncbi:MAG: N-acetylmuramoyl-L-alanine amidase [Gammaproteobacteria bacterium]|jgi:N-acetylmuramoyl-L-alanine amidase|nr:N-acetylmuramoyl-L-alanine amidase [Gammaproteobacteria bacterium]